MDTDFERYAEARAGALLRLAYLMCGDAQTAEDIVQEALVHAHRRWDRITRAGDPHRYVRRIVVNEHRSRRRRRAATEVVLPHEQLPAGSHADGQDALADRDLAWRVMGGLPARQRAVLVLRYFEDLPDTEIAATLRIAPGTVRSLAARAFAALRAHPDLADYAAPPTPSAPVSRQPISIIKEQS